MKTAIIVLGMHRSGTSLLAGILKKAGVNWGKNLLGSNSSNPKGHFELLELININDNILRDLNSSWDDIKELPENWWQEQKIIKYKNQIIKLFQNEFGDSKIFGFKEPRTCLLLPFYLEIFKETKIKPFFIIIKRKDIEIVKSLQIRNNIEINKSFDLYNKYNNSIQKYTEKENKITVEFEELVNYPFLVFDKLKNKFKINISLNENSKQEILKFSNPDLKHHNLEYQEFIRELINSFNVEKLDLNNKVETFQKEKDELVNKIKENKETQKNLNEKIENFQREKDELVKKLEENKEIQKNLNEKINTLNIEKNKLNTNIENYQKEQQKLTEKIKKEEDKSKILQANYLELNKINIEKDNKINNLNKENELLELNLNFIKRNLDDIEKSFSWKFINRIQKFIDFLFEDILKFKNYLSFINSLQNGFRQINDNSKSKHIDEKIKNKEDVFDIDLKIKEVKTKPLISIIIPFKDKPKLLINCLNSILKKSSYKKIEIICIDNNSKRSNILKIFKIFKHKKNITFKKFNKEFNYSEICNFGASFAKGEHLIFLNNDTKIITSNWIEEMLLFSQDEKTGAVGCKLLFSNKYIQHAGLSISDDKIAYHVALNKKRNYVGKYNQFSKPRKVIAVTGACLMIKSKLFNEIKGFDENLPIDFNDVDLCIKLFKLGFFNIYTPKAEVYHYESLTRKNMGNMIYRNKFSKDNNYFIRKNSSILLKGDPYQVPEE